MEDHCWCTCGKQIYDPNALYCSTECANADNVPLSMSTKVTVPQTPPVNLHFSITIPPNIYRASDSNAKVLSSPLSSSGSSFTSICTLDQNFNENYDYVYTGSNNHRNGDELVDDECYTTYYSAYSTSAPIDIPRSQVVSDPSLEPNKGTFGKEKSIF